jgi:hypothetical protein
MRSESGCASGPDWRSFRNDRSFHPVGHPSACDGTLATSMISSRVSVSDTTSPARGNCIFQCERGASPFSTSLEGARMPAGDTFSGPYFPSTVPVRTFTWPGVGATASVYPFTPSGGIFTLPVGALTRADRGLTVPAETFTPSDNGFTVQGGTSTRAGSGLMTPTVTSMRPGGGLTGPVERFTRPEGRFT